MDERSRRLHRLLGGNLVAFDKEFFELREDGFVAVTGSNESHHMTYYLFRKVGCPDIYLLSGYADYVLVVYLCF